MEKAKSANENVGNQNLNEFSIDSILASFESLPINLGLLSAQENLKRLKKAQKEFEDDSFDSDGDQFERKEKEKIKIDVYREITATQKTQEVQDKPIDLDLLNDPNQCLPFKTIPYQNKVILYVGNLSKDIRSKMLARIFGHFGTVVLSHIRNDACTLSSGYFGEIGLTSAADAQKAKSVLNYKKLNGLELRVCFGKSVENFKPEAEIFVTNLPKEATSRYLEHTCKKFGEIVTCLTGVRKDGETIGYVLFEEVTSARNAIEALSNSTTNGVRLTASSFMLPSCKPPNKFKIHVRNLPSQWDKLKAENELKEIFGKFGEITSLYVKTDKHDLSKQSLKAFVTYSSENSANKATEEMSQQFLDEAHKQQDQILLQVLSDELAIQMKKQKTEKRLAHQSLKGLMMKSLKLAVTREDIIKAFSKFGEIISVRFIERWVQCKVTLEQLKIAFMEFKNADDAEKAFDKARFDADVRALLHPFFANDQEFIEYQRPKIAVKLKPKDRSMKIRNPLKEFDLYIQKIQQKIASS